MSFMTSLANIIKEPKENQKLIKMILMALGIVLLLFTLIHANDILRVFVITAGALYLFTTEKLPIELTALLIMVSLMIFNLVTPSEGVSGFSNSATLTVLAMFILSAGIQKTGIIHTLGKYIFRFAGNNEIRQLLAIALIIAPISGIINNTAAVAIMLPMILDLAKRAKTSATKLLIPLSFLAMTGGMLTLIGTSTNILASNIYYESGYGEIGMFEFTKVGFFVLLATIIYFVIFGKWLLPKRKNLEEEVENNIDSNFLVEIQIEKGSNLIGASLMSSKFLEKNDLHLIKIIRGEQVIRKDAQEKVLEENDVIMLSADQKRIIELDKNDKNGIKLLLDFDESRRRFPVGVGQIAKVLIRSVNIFHQKSLSKIKFWERFGAAVVGVHREDVASKRLADLKLQTGETLLLKASKNALARIRNSNDFVVVETIEEEFNREKMWMAISIIAGVIALAAFNILPIMVSALAGVVLMVLTRCLDTDDLHESVSWDVIFLLAGVIPLGLAMQKSGAAELLANMLAKTGDHMHPLLLLMLFYVFTTILTEIISNNASIVLIAPIALSVADKLMLNPITFLLVVMFAASTSFLSPIGYQTNTMVFGAGNYKFSDFIKVGAPLNIILLFLSSLLIAYFWGF